MWSRRTWRGPLLQRAQQSLLKVRPPAVCAAAHCCAWHAALTPCYSQLLIPPLLEAGKGLRLLLLRVKVSLVGNVGLSLGAPWAQILLLLLRRLSAELLSSGCLHVSALC